MRVLVVLAQPPGLEAGAPARGAVAVLRGLSAHGLEVHALAARRTWVEETEVPADLSVELVDIESLRSRNVRHQLQRIRYPRGSLLRPLAARVAELAPDFDIIHMDETETAWCDKGSNRPASLQIHFRTLRDRRIPAPWTHEFRFLLEYVAAEHVAVRRYRSFVANSPQVAASLRRLNRRADVVFAPFALDPSHYPRASLDGQPLVGLIGTLDWPPTAGAVQRLLTHVWPRVRATVPDAKLLLAGRGTTAPNTTGVPSAEYVGEVSSAPDFISRLSVLLYPAVRGSGVKVKVLEAMACGVPVITTSPGSEGITSNDGVIVCANDGELVAAAARLLNDPGERRERGDCGRLTFLRYHTPIPATEPLVALFERMAARA